MSRTFNEATRVQMPAMVHLCRLGYHFYGKIHQETEGVKYDGKTNILLDVFRSKFEEFNPKNKKDFSSVLAKIQEELDYDDLGKAFYKRLTSSSPKLIDFDDAGNNDYHFTAEFTCKNGDNEFRPDITLFVNGLPLAFIEVKKPNNAGGMLAESKRMNETRFPNRAFRRFINITQLMIFSNNMEYDNRGGVIPVEGAFYCTGGRKNVPFNCFREQKKSTEEVADFILNRPITDDHIFDKTEEWILKEYNNQVIIHDPEYKENKKVTTPTNRILTSMCAPERLLFILRYGIAYVKQEKEEEDGKLLVRDEKHIMRYQQLFAALDIREKLKQGVKSGIVWHTQGSGKTALSFYLTKVLTDYYAGIKTVAKFYFIVDRLDLLTQATQEFEARGLNVQTANSKDELMSQFRTHQSLESNTGQMEITVVNIQKFAQDTEKVALPQYATNLQRIFIMDEAHRGYKPGGCFLANLFDADQNAVKIALTGTPLLAEERSSCKVFGSYLSTYYYDRSIADGYTRRIIREEIETSYRERINAIYEKLEGLVQKKDIKKGDVIEHPNYVDELLRYIIHDMTRFRSGYPTLNPGGMVICETSQQARMLYERFEQIQNEHNDKYILKAHFKAGLVLYDSDTKEGIKQVIKDFKKNETIDILFVFNMLLTGFDAPRLKRLYFCRQMDGHNLLQAITRVNRPYYDMRYGYLIDFANIKKNFDETNEAYLKELARVDDPDAPEEETLVHTFQSVMASQEEIIDQMRQIRNQLYDFTLDNAEIFSDQISTMEDKGVLLELKDALQSVRDMGNMVRTFGDEDLRRKFAELDISKLPDLLSEVQHRINLINARECFEEDADKRVMINEAMAEIEFNFSKISEEELTLASREELHSIFADVIREITHYQDPEDIEFMTIREAFQKRFHEYGFEVDTVALYTEQKKQLDEIMHRLRQLKMKNDALAYKYNGDYKFARIHKRIREQNMEREKHHTAPIARADDLMIETALKAIKNAVDEEVYNREQVLKKDAFFRQTVQHVIATTTKSIINLHITMDDWEFITPRICQQYVDQYNQTYSA